MRYKQFFLAVIFLSPLSLQAEPVREGALKLWYDKPANNAINEGLPVGNGRIGGLVFGGVETERIQLNVDSLWTGDDHSYGDYQTLGDLFLSFQNGPAPEITCPSGQKAGSDSEALRFSYDGDLSTKWYVETKDKPVIWQAAVAPGAEAVTSYILTSANDAPERDPKSWKFEGSMDGQQWTVLDRHDNEPSFAQRKQARSFQFSNNTAYRFYRFTFEETHGVPQFQIAEITVPGLASAEPKMALTDYRRELDISNAVERSSFVRGGVSYTREFFASRPSEVIVARWSSPQPGSITGSVSLRGAHQEITKAEGNTLSFAAALGNGQQYETAARVVTKGGTVTVLDNTLQIKGADEVVVLLAAATDYVFDYSKKNKSGVAPHAMLNTQLDEAAKKSYDELKAAHIADFQSIFNRVAVDFGESAPDQKSLPINQRKVKAAQAVDPELEALLFQYGRYLLISCSRPGGMPANLQGLWNDSNRPPWNSDYHANINLQMNYWGAETTNMAETAIPLFDWMKALLEPWRNNTRDEKEFALSGGKPVRGWAIRTGLNAWGAGTFKWDKTANAWLCQHLWEHYAFSGDKTFLRETAYPMIKEIVEFWEDHLKEMPDGRLVVPHGWSPEHGPEEDGVSYNQQIVWDLFTNYVEAADALGVDKPYRDKIAGMRDKLLGPAIGSWGQLLEWKEEKKNNNELDTQNDHHRHTSHLFAVYPGRQISVVKTPELAAAAKKSLDARGAQGDVREWSFAWRTALYARLHDAEGAHDMLQNLFSDRNSCLNMFGLHPPMQMDGNFGITAGIAEMLMQSHEDEINMLPALPKAWPTGSVRGLRARGGFEVDISWRDGKLVSATVRSVTGEGGKVRYGEKTLDPKLPVGGVIHLDGNLAKTN